MTDKEAMAKELEELAGRFSEGWHEGIKIDASDIMLLSQAAEVLAQPHETTLKEFNQFIHDDPNYHIWAKKREAKVEGSLHVVCECDKCKTHPPQRTWVGLTGEDVVKAYDDYQSGRVSAGFMGAVRAIEAKLKQKNGYAEKKNT